MGCLLPLHVLEVSTYFLVLTLPTIICTYNSYPCTMLVLFNYILILLYPGYLPVGWDPWVRVGIFIFPVCYRLCLLERKLGPFFQWGQIIWQRLDEVLGVILSWVIFNF